jgi:hypothetical protein
VVNTDLLMAIKINFITAMYGKIHLVVIVFSYFLVSLEE